MYAIVDIETTGGFSAANRIIEIAVVVHDGYGIISEYQTLINPHRMLPGFITGLTGITAEMLEGAPSFSEIAKDLFDLLKDKVFVAHNVNFDHSFVKSAFAREGLAFNVPQLCTVRLSRKLFPGFRSYSLGSLCDQRGIRIENRHRAMGDAYATALLFEQLLREDKEGTIPRTLKARSKAATLPPHISPEKFAGLPEATGVYYFHDQQGRIIYVGKAVNIKSRFKGHFSGNAKLDLKAEVHDVSYELTGSEFLALLVETLEIKKYWPKYNRAIKAPSSRWGIFTYLDQLGYIRFGVGKVGGIQDAVCSFNTHADAWHYLIRELKIDRLCPKLCGIHKVPGACYEYHAGDCLGACQQKEGSHSYNERANAMLDRLRLDEKTILIRERGRGDDEEAALLFEKGLLAAFGFISKEEAISHPEEMLERLKPVKPVPETSYLLRSYLERGGNKNIYYLRT
ncbi:DNA polymerase III epsilon subunit [Lunatimonas lonarensis]|uniref:DNA polymerase III epsilon subunit n=1 Tax=Lunatimonas lonarensis TaxID=1232681 RepID=R7ZV39_9BACT|nr:exonuclease domain-containing protein [Lunatimonas lonarensis]EON77947.1 DNA polymerase III epsilon subunit [Lunatimonas lonarensis]